MFFLSLFHSSLLFLLSVTKFNKIIFIFPNRVFLYSWITSPHFSFFLSQHISFSSFLFRSFKPAYLCCRFIIHSNIYPYKQKPRSAFRTRSFLSKKLLLCLPFKTPLSAHQSMRYLKRWKLSLSVLTSLLS